MTRMQRVRVEHWVRVSAGLGLFLLLVAAQEKHCPTGATSGTPTDAAPCPDEGGDARKPRKTPLPLIVPDLTAQRFAVPGAGAELRLERGSRDGAVSRGPERGGPPDPMCAAVEAVPPWRRLAPRLPESVSPGPQVDQPPTDPLLTAIYPLGPPAPGTSAEGRRAA